MTRKELQAAIDLLSPDLKIHVGKPMSWGGVTSYTLRHEEDESGRILAYSIALTGREVFGVKPILERAVKAMHERVRHE